MGRRLFACIGMMGLYLGTIQVTSIVLGDSRANAAVESKYGGILRIADFNSYPGFCVGQNPNGTALGAYRAVLETLVERNSDDGFTPYLAESIESNSQNTVWTIRLRPGIKFHDGTYLDSAALKLNLDSLRGIATGTIPVTRVVGIVNLGLTNILEVNVVDELSVSVVLERPQIDFMEMVYLGGKGFMRAPAQLRSSTCSQNPIGTGPFRLTSFGSSALTMDRNTDYWRTDPSTGDSLPYLDRLEFVRIAEAPSRKEAVTGTASSAATADIAMFSSTIDSSEIGELRANPQSVREYSTRNDSVVTLYLNAGKVGSPLRNRNARLALAHATDFARILNVRFGGLGETPESLIPRRSEMFTSEGFATYDPDLARSYVAAYKAETGASSLNISMPTTSGRDSATWNLLQSIWAESGINLALNVEEPAVTISKAVNASRDGAEQNAYDLVPLTMSMGSETGYNSQFLRADAFNPNSTNSVFAALPSIRSRLATVLNFSHQPETAMDEKLLLAHSQSTLKDSAVKFREAMAHYQSQAYAIPIVNGFLAVFANPTIHGFGESFLAPGVREKQMNPGGPNWAYLYRSSAEESVNVRPNSGMRSQNWTGAHPQGVVSTLGGRVFVARTDEGEICEMSTGVPTGCIDVGGRPSALAINSAEDRLYFLDVENRSLRQLGLADHSISNVASLSARPFALALAGNSGNAYVSSVAGNVIYKVNLMSGVVDSSVRVTSGPAGLIADVSRSILWVSQVRADGILKIRTSEFIATQAASVRSASLANDFLELNLRPTSMTMSVDGQSIVYVDEVNDTVGRIDVQRGVIESSVGLGGQPRFISPGPDVNKFYTSSLFSNSVSLVELPPRPTGQAAPPVQTNPVQVPAAAPQNSTTSSGQALVFKVGKAISSRSLTSAAGLTARAGERVLFRVAPTSRKVCKASGTTVKTFGKGTCRVTVSVVPRKGRVKQKTVSLKIK